MLYAALVFFFLVAVSACALIFGSQPDEYGPATLAAAAFLGAWSMALMLACIVLIQRQRAANKADQKGEL